MDDFLHAFSGKKIFLYSKDSAAAELGLEGGQRISRNASTVIGDSRLRRLELGLRLLDGRIHPVPPITRRTRNLDGVPVAEHVPVRLRDIHDATAPRALKVPVGLERELSLGRNDHLDLTKEAGLSPEGHGNDIPACGPVQPLVVDARELFLDGRSATTTSVGFPIFFLEESHGMVTTDPECLFDKGVDPGGEHEVATNVVMDEQLLKARPFGSLGLTLFFFSPPSSGEVEDADADRQVAERAPGRNLRSQSLALDLGAGVEVPVLISGLMVAHHPRDQSHQAIALGLVDVAQNLQSFEPKLGPEDEVLRNIVPGVPGTYPQSLTPSRLVLELLDQRPCHHFARLPLEHFACEEELGLGRQLGQLLGRHLLVDEVLLLDERSAAIADEAVIHHLHRDGLLATAGALLLGPTDLALRVSVGILGGIEPLAGARADRVIHQKLVLEPLGEVAPHRTVMVLGRVAQAFIKVQVKRDRARGVVGDVDPLPGPRALILPEVVLLQRVVARGLGVSTLADLFPNELTIVRGLHFQGNHSLGLDHDRRRQQVCAPHQLILFVGVELPLAGGRLLGLEERHPLRLEPPVGGDADVKEVAPLLDPLLRHDRRGWTGVVQRVPSPIELGLAALLDNGKELHPVLLPCFAFDTPREEDQAGLLPREEVETHHLARLVVILATLGQERDNIRRGVDVVGIHDYFSTFEVEPNLFPANTIAREDKIGPVNVLDGPSAMQ